MSDKTLPPPSERIRSVLTEAGYGEAAVQALLALDADHFHYVRRVMKGDVPQSLMDELGAGLEATQFHALSAILRIRFGYGREAAEATVGLLAEEMSLDPSRASRIASDLVERGLLLRAVSQADGRRSVLEPTEAAFALLDGFLKAKWRRTMRLFSTWSEEDILTFSRLFGRYTEGMRAEYPGTK
ncbi:MarR family winged helix-turn-helix transcriptional regulator [Stagnihabitans tardus]|uniref:MarR family transcriptional regulator n=1 Tax=Stagnihabitans tardus TaxID=2699202 RepID=A0AAE5BUS7_9RHOB|nr:MarR family transcriptional regulator [Stagnihabitans tardus]NBZ87094.1 MarR family transcriptional regulator [Stagnihabitans tardus]